MKSRIFFGLTHVMLALAILPWMSCSSASTVNDSRSRFKSESTESNLDSAQIKVRFLLKELSKSASDYVMVVAHRGDWRNAPENSILSLQYAVAMGVDMVEVDVKKTKDNVLIAMHDMTVDRTTTGKGEVKDITWEDLKKLNLRSGNGSRTRHGIPTLREFMLAAKELGVLVNIDKGIDYAKEIGKVLKETETQQLTVVKSGMKPADLLTILPDLKGVHFMPVIALDRDEKPMTKIEQYMAFFSPSIMEISFQQDTSVFFNDPTSLTKKGVKIWNTPCSFMWSGGHDDEIAVDFNKPEESWGWLINKGATILLTDRPQQLIAYLDQRGLRNRE